MKKFTALLLVFSMMFITISVQAYSTANYKNGDVDKNGFINVSDATIIQKSLAGLTVLDEEQQKLSDYDLSGNINVSDATKIQKVIAGIDTAPVEPTTPVVEPDPQIPQNINVYFSNNKNWSNVYFYLYNSKTEDTNAAWPGKKITNYTTNNLGEKIYSSTVDVSKYDRIIFNNNSGSQTVNTPINKASSGFFIASGTGKYMMPGTYAYKGSDKGKIVTTNLLYSTGYNKKIWIWTPADYSETSQKKYKTVYIMDGQNLFDNDHSDSYGGWQVTDAVESMMSNGGRGMIIVGIDNGNAKRDSELTPDIGAVKPQYQSEFYSRTGKAFSDFVVNKVMPYVQKNYNSSTAANDNAIVGSSSGGLESFYIGMEHSDKFGHIGALSPAFALFSTSVWNTYLSKFNFTSGNMPRLYIYNGNGDSTEKELYSDTCSMYTSLISKGYNKDKITLVLEEEAKHNEGYWRLIFPEMLCWCYRL